MSEVKYSQAPVSEVLCGITFETPILNDSAQFIHILEKLREAGSVFQLQPPISNQTYDNYELKVTQDKAQTGAVRFHLRSADGKWLFQLQNNKIYVNWIRGDKNPPGNYPGFTLVYKKFQDALSLIAGTAKVTQYELTYQDRIDWERHQEEISDIFKLTLPIFLGQNPSYFSCLYLSELKKLGGHSEITIAVAPENPNLLVFQCVIRGVNELIQDDWFQEARKTQLTIFEDFLQEKKLLSWQ